MATETKDTATARPWRNTRGGDIGGERLACIAYGIDDAERDANAALIVRAVNAHDALVAALAALANVGSDGRCQSCGCDPEPEGYCGCLPLRDAVENERRCAGRRALKLARGEV